MTFSNLQADSIRFAHLLRKRELRGGDTLAVLLENRPDFYTLIWGSQRAGTIVILISSRFTARELANILGDVVVIGAPDADLGERVVAVVQPADMAEAEAEIELELRAYLKPQLAGIEFPRASECRNESPREDNGKLDKRELRDEGVIPA